MTEEFLDQIRNGVRDRGVRTRQRMAMLKRLEERGAGAARAELQARLDKISRRVRKAVDQLRQTVR